MPDTLRSRINKAEHGIDGATSVVMDALRLGAALIVLVLHASDMWFPGQAHSPEQPGNASHAAVVIFFVLSGFVIAFTAATRHQTLDNFLSARLSRLCSLVIPALLLTALVELSVRVQGNPSLIETYVRGMFGPRYLISGLFLNEIWYFSAAPPANIALWSLSFEFWYYVIFGLWFCTGRSWMSCLLALGACAIAGPKILIMMPIWLIGCAAYWLPRPRIPASVGWILAASAGIAAVLAGLKLNPWPYPIGEAPFYFANQFVTDWVVGLFLAVSLWLLPPASNLTGSQIPPLFVKRFRAVADLTFPIYVFHFPLLVLVRVIFGNHVGDPVQFFLAILGALIISSMLGMAMDRQRLKWSCFFLWMFGQFRNRIAPKFIS